MKQIIRLTESDLHSIIENTIKQIIAEDGESAATNGAGFFNGANNSNTSAAATFTTPFGGVQRRKGYSPKSKSNSETNDVDMSDALARHNGKGGSISIPKKRV